MTVPDQVGRPFAAGAFPPVPEESTLPLDRLSPAEQILLQRLPDVIGLDLANERVRAGAEAGSVFIATQPPPLEDLTILRPPSFYTRATWKGRETLGEWARKTLLELAMVRAWRAMGTSAPPATTLFTTRLTRCVIDEFGIDVQDLVDRVFTATGEPVAGAPGMWRMAGATPPLLRHASNMKRAQEVERRITEPWLAGRRLGRHLTLSGIGVSADFALFGDIYRRNNHETYEVRTTMRLPETVITAAAGRRITELVEHPLLARLGGTVVSAEAKAAGCRFTVELETGDRAQLDHEHHPEFRRHWDELKTRLPAVTDLMCEALGVRR